MKELISIIVPVYNAGKYLSRCIKSILNQTYENIELILVNDASSDDSGKICRKYEAIDRRIIVKNHEINKGAGMARNTGLDAANGWYIMFVDSDDYVPKNYVEELYRLSKKTGSQMAACLGKETYNLSIETGIENSVLEPYEIMDCDTALENLCYQRKISPGPWAKIYERTLFEDVRFPNTGYEDLAVIYRLLHNARQIAYSPIEKYYYVQRAKNTTLGKFNEKKMDRIAVAEDMRKFIFKYHTDLREAVVVRCFLASIQTLNVLPLRMCKSSYTNILKSNIKKYRKYVLKNPKAKLSTRIMALCSYGGIYVLKVMGIAYNFSRGQYNVKLQ